jgi:hypothetical protein
MNAVPAAYAIVLIDKSHPIFGFEGCSDRTHLDTWGSVTLVTKFGDKEASEYIFLLSYLWEAVNARIRAVYSRVAIRVCHVTFNPRAKVERFSRNVVLDLACIRASAAPYALVYLYSHTKVVTLSHLIA